MRRIDEMPGLSRRDALKCGLLGAAGLMMPRGIVQAAAKPALQAKAKSVIQIWMWGGPCHIDTFDPKPDAGRDYTGPLNSAVSTNADGVLINAALPLLAKQADKYSIIRSMTHGVNGHETASYMVQTGRKPGEREVYPSVGAVVSLKKGYDAGYKGLLPPYIVVTRPQGRFSEAGFLGLKYRPFATGGDPRRTPFAVEGIITEGVSRKRQENRRKLLRDLDSYQQLMPENELFRSVDAAEEKAYDMILGDAGKVFDLSAEKESLRETYGMSTFGQACLLARRLVEAGVPYITINYNGWDTHKKHFESMNRMLPELDKGFATLLSDLSDRGLLDSTIVWWGGEFGRTPKVKWDAPWNGGRSHFGAAFSTVLAGGGFRGGQVIGATDDKGMRVEERPVYPADVIGSIYTQLGIDPAGTLPHPQRLVARLTPTEEEGFKLGGRLTEIM